MSNTIQTSPKLPWKTRFFLSASSFAADASCRSNGTINRFLFNLIDLKSSPSKKPFQGVATFDITVDPSRNLWFRLYVPTENSRVGLPVVVFLHGGGFSFLSANSKAYDDVCRRFARELPAIVVSVNYRLSPEHKFPAQYEDGFDVLKFLDQKGYKDFPAHGDLSKCFLAGDSAGANLAHHLALKASGHVFQEVKIAGLVSIQPFFGGEERTESEIRLAGAPLASVERTDWLWKAFLPEGSNRDHPVVNVFGPKSDDISALKFPPTVVVVGGFDPLIDWQKRYYDGLKKCGKEAYLIEYPNAIHTFYAFPELPESAMFINEFRTFVQKQSAT